VAAVPGGREVVFADNFLLAAGSGCDVGLGPGSGTAVSRQAYVEQEMWRAVHQQKQGSLGRTLKNAQKAQLSGHVQQRLMESNAMHHTVLGILICVVSCICLCRAPLE
jgi:hypothetical protein